MQKQIQFKVKGMQRDLSVSAFSPEYAYENKNIRIMSTDDSTLLSIVNEKGNKPVDITGIGNYLKGIPIGQALIDNELIVFTTSNNESKIVKDISSIDEEVPNIINNEFIINIDSDIDDNIYKLWFDKNTLMGKRMYNGNLNFNYKYPIETISVYESQEIKKVYWTDGLNQPRVINIAAASDIISKWNDDSFNFVKKLKLQETITIERNIVASGIFSPGTIQYAFTYFNQYGQESNIFYVSPLHYISHDNRGASPEDKIGNSFTITVDNIDTSFDYIRIYSIHRTSIDAVPTVRRVVDLAPPTETSIYGTQYWRKYSSKANIEVFDINQNKYVSLSLIEPTYSSPTSNTWEFTGLNYRYLRFSDGDYTQISDKDTIVVDIHNASNTWVYYKDLILPVEVHSYNAAKITYTDDGESGDIIDPTELLYIGGEEVVFGTMSQKDNTLFLGNISIKRKLISNHIRDFFKGKEIKFTVLESPAKYLQPPKPLGYYPYDNQLKFDSYKIKTFKYLETYRFGVQFQHINGKWSEPIWINDVRNTRHVQSRYIKDDKVYLPIASYILDDSSIINELVSQGYIRVRPVVVFPSLTDRECVCQGVICPTVFNMADRFGNSPFAQSSWFIRANAPFDEYRTFHVSQSSDGTWKSDWSDREGLDSPSINSRAGVISNNITNVTDNNGNTYKMEIPNRGAWAEFRHLHFIPPNFERNAEIQCINVYHTPDYMLVHDAASESDIRDKVAGMGVHFGIDQSIVTLHSPDIEFDDSIKNMDTSGLQLRIVGMVPLTSFIGDIDIQTSTPANIYKGTSTVAPGFYKESVCSENISRFGWKGLMSGGFWFDEITGLKLDQNTNRYATGFVVYPFHRNGSLNNTEYAVNGYRSAMLDKKKLSNMRFSYNTHFLDLEDVYDFYKKGDSKKTGISGVSVFNSNEVSLVRLPAPENSGLEDINYYGNIDKVLTLSRVGDDVYGYNIVITGVQSASSKGAHKLFSSSYMRVLDAYTSQYKAYDPISMKYKSTAHAVMALNYSQDNYQRVMPTIKDGNITLEKFETWYVNPVGDVYKDSKHTFWDKKKICKGVHQDVLDIRFGKELSGSDTGYSIDYGWLWLGEIYNPNVTNRFGGQTEEAFESNKWLPCGDPISLLDNNITKNSVNILWTEGDTYYQRYDHIKTYPFTLEDQNAITDIVSFMCETRVNLDGRYDKNRGQTNNFSITPANFNLINKVYNQENNFFTYRAINANRLNLDNFPNLLTWTKTKTAGELIDTWTNITLASTLDFDGDKGKIRAIRRFNNNLIAFQDRGISQILYNDSIQISSTEGVPIEIVNSNKVNGKRYLSDKIGCTNKWSLCETPNGIYFIDDITKGIFLFNGELNNLSDRLGFHSWINAKSTGINIWDPVDFNGFVTYYDKVNGDVFFISKDECLAFSEPLGQFTSFYSYEKMPYFSNLEDRGISFNVQGNGTLYRPWLHNEGDYNMFFGVYQPFYTTVIADPDMQADKVFNNLEFRADSWGKNGNLLNTTFDTLATWNEYQEGVVDLTNIPNRPSTLKKKFRIWRANIPRASTNGRDRMRNPWLYIKLSMEGENTNKTMLHDMIVHYFE